MSTTTRKRRCLENFRISFSTRPENLIPSALP
jgi:hypothetical protein